MSQIFHPSANTIARASVFGALFVVAAALGALAVWSRSDYVTGVGVPQVQPVQFSHKHHVGDEGFDCRYCHTTVETSAFAGIPPTQVCMNCHSQIWSTSPALAPVHDSYTSGKPLVWERVNNLPGFVYFNHSIHVQKGVGCVTCHGRVDEMPLTMKTGTMLMEWCLDCHRNPEKYVRPREFVTSMDYKPPADQIALGQQLVKEYQIQSKISCSVCHR